MWILFGGREALERPLPDVSELFPSKSPVTFRHVLRDESVKRVLVEEWGLSTGFEEGALDGARPTLSTGLCG